MHADLNKLQTAVWVYDIDNFCIIWANEAGLEFWGSPNVVALRQRDLHTGASHAVKQTLLDYQDALKAGKTFQENWVFTPHNKEIKAFCQCSGIKLEGGRIGMLVEAVRMEDSYSNFYFNDSLIISTFALSGEFISGNPSFNKEYGSNIGMLSELFKSSADHNQFYEVLVKEKIFEGDVQLLNISGAYWYRVHATTSFDSNGKAIILLHHHNIDERKTFELSLEKQASTDPLTQLLNRRGFNCILEQAIKLSEPQRPNYFSLLYIDLNGFKAINDAYGHSVGDKLLIEVSQRLTQLLDDQCVLARFGGDEFVLFTQNVCSKESLRALSDQLLMELSLPYKDVPIKSLSASIGSVCFPEDATSIDQLISRADAAMYYAKQQGNKQHMMYKQGMNLRLKRASDISVKLATAIEENSLCLYYQPIVDTSVNQLFSFEALLRWYDDKLGYVNPEEIIQIAESTGLIETLEMWVLHQSLSDLVQLRRLFTNDLTVSVNMSGLHLSRIGAAERVSEILKYHQLTPEDLIIELTENVLIDNLENNQCQAQELVRRGIRISLDDFGTGYSSLAYLHMLPASVLKVDKMFTNNIQKHKVTLECICKLSCSFNMCGLAEGVETKEQYETLKDIGFHLQQGYWFGRPQPLSYYEKAENQVFFNTK